MAQELMKTRTGSKRSEKKNDMSHGEEYAERMSRVDEGNVVFFKDILCKGLKDREFCVRLTQTRLKPDHFPRKYMSWVYASLKDFISNPRYGSRLPTRHILVDRLKGDSSVDKEQKILFAKKIEDLYSHEIHSEQYSMDVVENRINYREFKESLENTLRTISPTDVAASINRFVSNSFKIANKNAVQVVDLYDEAGKRQQERLYIKKNPKKFKRFHFGIKSVDKCLPSGLMAPMMGSIAGKTGRGKSVLTITFGSRASEQRLNVTHITSENENSQTTGRYDSKITNLKYDDIQLFKLSKKSRKKYDRVYKTRMDRSKFGRIKIVKFPPNDFTAASIQHVLNMLEADGHKTDLLIVDSPDLMQSVLSNLKDKRLQQAAIYWELKCLLEIKQCIGLVTTQLNKMSSDDNPLAEDLSESYDKARMLDFLMVFSQSKTQKSVGEASLIIVKNRDGQTPAEPIDIIQMFSRMSFVEKPPEDSSSDADAPKKFDGGLKVIDGGKAANDDNINKLRSIASPKPSSKGLKPTKAGKAGGKGPKMSKRSSEEPVEKKPKAPAGK